MANSSTNHEHTHDVFLSHSSSDNPIVLELAQRLRADGLRVWIDNWEIQEGDSIPSKIEQGLENSRVLVLCMSKNAFGSDWATLESQTFRFRDPLNKQRRFMPLRLDDTEPPGSLKQFKYVDWRGVNREEAYQRLLNACVGTAGSFSSSQQRAVPGGKAEESSSSSADESDTDDSHYDERTAELHAEIRRYIAEFNAEIFAKIANAFELKMEANLTSPVAQKLLFDHIVGTQWFPIGPTKTSLQRC